MEVTIPVTQLRGHIGSILKRLRENPDLVFKITHHREVVAELKAPEIAAKAQDSVSTQQEIADFIEAYMKGALLARKGAYQRIQKLCATPVDPLPYPNVEEAMQAIRGRARDIDRL